MNVTGDGTRIPEAKEWYVTAPHRMANRTGAQPPKVPYGISHVRKVGALLTACGLPALEGLRRVPGA